MEAPPLLRRKEKVATVAVGVAFENIALVITPGGRQGGPGRADFWFLRPRKKSIPLSAQEIALLMAHPVHGPRARRMLAARDKEIAAAA